MNLLLAFAPFITFAVIDRLFDSLAGLIAAAIVSAILLLRDKVAGHREWPLLEIGTLLLFGGLAAYAAAFAPDWSVIGVRLRVDAGLLAVVLLSIAAGRPFTLVYARRSVPAALWDQPEFLRTNVVISTAWALAFAALVAADVLMLLRPDLPLRLGILVTVAALVGAVKFTDWYAWQQRAMAK